MQQKHLNYSYKFVFCFIIPLVITSFCSFNIQDSVNYIEDNPFTKSEYQNTEIYFRCIGIGTSTNLGVAQEKAMFDAKTRLTKALIKSYKNCLPGKSIEKVCLTNIKKLKEENLEGEDNAAICWVIIEANKSEILANLLNSNSKYQPDDKRYKLLMKKFEKEMKLQKNISY